MLASKCMHSLIYAPKSLIYRIHSVVMKKCDFYRTCVGLFAKVARSKIGRNGTSPSVGACRGMAGDVCVTSKCFLVMVVAYTAARESNSKTCTSHNIITGKIVKA